MDAQAELETLWYEAWTLTEYWKVVEAQLNYDNAVTTQAATDANLVADSKMKLWKNLSVARSDPSGNW